VELLRNLSVGAIDPETLPIETRRRCVEHLTHQAFTNDEIAELMRVTERTIQRDRAALRKETRLEPDRRLGDELLGEYERIVSACVARLTRLARDPSVHPYARLWADEAMSKTYARFIDAAYRLNYFESGRERLNHQRATDPEQLEREQAQLAFNRKKTGML